MVFCGLRASCWDGRPWTADYTQPSLLALPGKGGTNPRPALPSDQNVPMSKLSIPISMISHPVTQQSPWSVEER